MAETFECAHCGPVSGYRRFKGWCMDCIEAETGLQWQDAVCVTDEPWEWYGAVDIPAAVRMGVDAMKWVRSDKRPNGKMLVMNWDDRPALTTAELNEIRERKAREEGIEG